MAVGTTAAILGGASIVGGGIKSITAAKQKRNAKRAARNFKRQGLRNVNEGRRISTLGADLQREEMARTSATAIDAFRSGGTRGVANAANVVAQNNLANRRIGADLDRQQVNLDRDFAEDEARMRQMQENRESQELAAIQGQMNAANEQLFSGFGDIASGFGAFAGDLDSNQPTSTKKYTT